MSSIIPVESDSASAAIASAPKSSRATPAAASPPVAATGADRPSPGPSSPDGASGAANASASLLSDAAYLHLFSVPLMTYVWPDSAALNEQLRSRILAIAKHQPSIQATNVGGWHSPNGQLEFLEELREPLFQRMLLMANEATGRYISERALPSLSVRWSFLAWANVSQAGDFNHMHTHPGMTWSGVYYVDAGESPGQRDSAVLRFMDPSPASAASFLPFRARVNPEIQPVAGLMLLFPSYLPHSVPPHRGSRPRISIAFNFRSEPYP